MEVGISIKVDPKDLIHLKELLMAVSQEVQQILDKVNGATTNIANRIQRLIDQSDGIGPEERAAFDTVISQLEALGQDPENPTPENPTPGEPV